MSILETIQNLISGITENLGGSAGEIIGGVTEITESPIVQDLQDQASTLTETVAEPLSSISETGQTAVDNIKQKIGL
jgi:hypothetical protein